MWPEAPVQGLGEDHRRKLRINFQGHSTPALLTILWVLSSLPQGGSHWEPGLYNQAQQGARLSENETWSEKFTVALEMLIQIPSAVKIRQMP